MPKPCPYLRQWRVRIIIWADNLYQGKGNIVSDYQNIITNFHLTEKRPLNPFNLRYCIFCCLPKIADIISKIKSYTSNGKTLCGVLKRFI